LFCFFSICFFFYGLCYLGFSNDGNLSTIARAEAV